MRYCIVSLQDGNIYLNLHFKNLKSARNYYSNSLKDSKEFEIRPVIEDDLKQTVKYYDDALKDIYHAIELEKDDDKLITLAYIAKDVLKRRRKLKNKQRGVGNTSIMLSVWKNRTTILQDYGYQEGE